MYLKKHQHSEPNFKETFVLKRDANACVYRRSLNELENV